MTLTGEGNTRQSVAVVGAGAVGGVFASALHRAGHDVSLCVRTPFDELVIETSGGTEHVPVTVVTDPADVRPVDWVLLAVKAFDTAGTARWLAALCDEHTTVVVLRNGVEQTDDVQALVPKTTVLPALVYIQAERLAPGHIRHGYGNSLDVPAGPAADRLTRLFQGSGTDIRPQQDLLTAAWRKLMLNAAVNPLTALTLRRMEVMGDRMIRDLAEGLMRETQVVAEAVGARLTGADVLQTLAFMEEFSDGNGTSMLYDRLSGNSLEWEALNGAVVRYADLYGIDVPLNRAMTALLHALAPLHAAPTAEEPAGTQLAAA
ncbi:2-dehydropantoate 2-reductase [Streptomyces sp. Act143]|uniref:2-dehydropantoate 2-reductase n=1 Tax=Streptomyces sp. Act143 TaxID=2200760 RepID=UPI0015E8126C|nr:2-dehydropantoate 2-reductase [Streptomyces sp. Act143]